MEKSETAAKKTPHRNRLDNQKAQLDKHGNFAEVLVRTTSEASDLINMARLWESLLIHADRQTRGYVAKISRAEYDATQAMFKECLDVMVDKLKVAAQRHEMDWTGNTFMGRIAQRYGVATAKKAS